MKTLEKNKNRKESYQSSWDGVPALIKQDLTEDSLYRSFFLSLISHFIGALLIWLITFSIVFFGLAPKILTKPKVKDIVFTMNKIAKTKAGNQAATIVPSLSPEATSPTPKTTQHIETQTKVKTPSNSSIPDFDMPIPKINSISSGSNKIKHHATGIETSNSSISGIESNTSTNANQTGQSGFDKTSAKKVATPYDISPYINELKRNIRWNWKASKNYPNKRVELFLRIAKDGKLIILNVKNTSETAEVDNAALNAVRKSTPLNPLPNKYTRGFLDVIFIFDSATGSISSRR